MKPIQICPLTGIGEVQPGADLSAILLAAIDAAGIEVAADDLLIVTQKIVSKSEDRFVALADVEPSSEAQILAGKTLKDSRLVELVLRESTDVLRAVPNVLIVRHRLGLVMANAGIDRSNIGARDEDCALLLPLDPDASAAQLHSAIGCPVVISDSFGRPWRLGVTGVAIGSSGIPALVDRRGSLDRDGRKLEVTQIALADLLACAAALATGEGSEGIPAALIRGYQLPEGDVPATSLNRPLEEDLFR